MKKETRLQANVTLNDKNSVQFLLSDYQQCFEHMRHYDSVGISLVKFVFTSFAAITSGAFALFRYFEGQTYQNSVVGGILLLTFAIGLISLAMMLRNRVYFIVVARQVNSLRNYFLNNMALNFKNYNVCYDEPSSPKYFNPWSSYTLLFAIVALINGALGGFGSYLIIKYFGTAEFGASWVIGLVIGVGLVILQLTSVVLYLALHDKSGSGDEAASKVSSEEGTYG